jgi:hypothetical protein
MASQKDDLSDEEFGAVVDQFVEHFNKVADEEKRAEIDLRQARAECLRAGDHGLAEMIGSAWIRINPTKSFMSATFDVASMLV